MSGKLYIKINGIMTISVVYRNGGGLVKKKLLALGLCIVMTLGLSLNASASYCSGTLTNQTKTIGNTTHTWSGSYLVSTSTVSGTVSCSTAHDVSVYLHVRFKMGDKYYTNNVGNTADPGTYAAKQWDAGSGRTVQATSYVLLEIEGLRAFKSN